MNLRVPPIQENVCSKGYGFVRVSNKTGIVTWLVIRPLSVTPQSNVTSHGTRPFQFLKTNTGIDYFQPLQLTKSVLKLRLSVGGHTL